MVEGDVEKLRTASYPPLSDGYLDWIPAKRRRVVSKTKRVSLLLTIGKSFVVCRPANESREFAQSIILHAACVSLIQFPNDTQS